MEWATFGDLELAHRACILMPGPKGMVECSKNSGLQVRYSVGSPCFFGGPGRNRDLSGRRYWGINTQAAGLGYGLNAPLALQKCVYSSALRAALWNGPPSAALNWPNGPEY